MKFLFDVLILPISISENIFVDTILFFIVSPIAYKSAYFLVGKLGFRGLLGSIIHWTIRFIVYFALCFLIRLFIRIYKFIVSIPIQYYIALLLIFLLVTMIVYSLNNKKSFLNKKLF